MAALYKLKKLKSVILKKKIIKNKYIKGERAGYIIKGWEPPTNKNN